MMGLLFIAIGTGGIKPCVSTFGGDQFSSDQVIFFVTMYSISEQTLPKDTLDKVIKISCGMSLLVMRFSSDAHF